MTNNNTEIIESNMNWMMILNTLITTLEQRKRHFTDDMSQDSYIAMLDQFTENLKLPQTIATTFATMLNNKSTDKLLDDLKVIQMDLHDDYNEITPLPSTKIFHPEEDIDAFLDSILEKKKKQAQRLFANKNKMIVEEFEKEMLHLKMINGEMKVIPTQKKK